MKLYYAIIDKTSTSDKYILGEQDELCQFWCDAQLYQTIEEAQRQIEHANWGDWAEIITQEGKRVLDDENEYEAHAEFEKRNFRNEIRYQEGYYDNDEEIRIKI